MKKNNSTFLVIVGLTSFAVNAGNCDYPWQNAKYSSSCDGRAADVCPDGRQPNKSTRF